MFAIALRLPVFRVLQVFALLAFVFMLGCAALNPIAHAQTPEQKYDAALLTYDAVLEPALELLEDPTAPPNLRQSLKASIIASGEIYAAGTEAFANFKEAKAAVAAGGPGAQLDVATENLGAWIEQLETTLARLQTLTAR